MHQKNDIFDLAIDKMLGSLDISNILKKVGFSTSFARGLMEKEQREVLDQFSSEFVLDESSMMIN